MGCLRSDLLCKTIADRPTPEFGRGRIGALRGVRALGHSIRTGLSAPVLPNSPLFVVITAVGLETLQHLTPDRHGHLSDALEKVIGGLAVASQG